MVGAFVAGWSRRWHLQRRAALGAVRGDGRLPLAGACRLHWHRHVHGQRQLHAAPRVTVSANGTEPRLAGGPPTRRGHRRRQLHADARALVSWRGVSHNGVEIATASTGSADAGAFGRELAERLAEWTAEGRNAAWLPLGAHQLHLCEAAFEQGFVHHHAKGRQLVMVKWLPTAVENKVPPFGFHQVGCGALVLNTRGEMLLVKERMRRVDRWKMPGGLVDPGESIPEGVVREVLEETGVRAQFQSVLGFWQRPLGADQGDMYFVCRLSATAGGDAIDFDPHEIAECKWVAVREYLQQPEHPVIRRVLARSFGLQRPEDLDGDADMLPWAELSPDGIAFQGSDVPFQFFSVAAPPRS